MTHAVLLGGISFLAGVAPASGADPWDVARISQGPVGGDRETTGLDPGLALVSGDGSAVAFPTNERLVHADLDDAADVYSWSEATGLRLVSTGPIDGAGDHHAELSGISEDGTRIWFETRERLVAADSAGEDSNDVYERHGDSTSLVSTGPADAGNASADFVAASTDGGRVVFNAFGQLIPSEPGDATNVYAREGGSTTLISPDGTLPPSDADAFAIGVSASAQNVVYSSEEQLLPSDTDDQHDLYEWAGGVTRHVSLGPAGGNTPSSVSNGAAVRNGGISRNGTGILFSTSESLVADDDDGWQEDLYVRAGNTIHLATGGPDSNFPATNPAISADGDRVYFESDDQFADADDDFWRNIYVWTEGGVAMVAPNGESPVTRSFVGLSRDGSTVLLATSAPLVAADTDEDSDLYALRAGAFELIAPDLPAPYDGSQFATMSNDGARMFFWASNQAQPDNAVFEYAGGETHLVAAGAPCFACTFLGPNVLTGGDGSSVFLRTFAPYASHDCDERLDLYAAKIGEFAPTSLPPSGGPPCGGDPSPDTSIVSGPADPGNDPSPSFELAATEPATFHCSLDSAPFAPCSGPGAGHTISPDLDDGNHELRVRAEDEYGQFDPEPASRDFVIDTRRPKTSLNPSRNGQRWRFKFEGDEAGSFECKLDWGKRWTECESPVRRRYSAKRTHRFAVRAIDEARNVDSTPAKRVIRRQR